MNTKYMLTVVLMSLGLIIGLLCNRQPPTVLDSSAFDKNISDLAWEIEKIQNIMAKVPEDKPEISKEGFRRMEKDKKK